nr:hypothetical protein [Methanocella conradii]
MCGIVGYIGNGNTAEVLLESLARLEYRGYDSAGIALVCDGHLSVVKSYGRIFNLKEKVPHGIMATVGIGHTRWATHGEPSGINAHPHKDCTGKFAVVHNGWTIDQVSDIVVRVPDACEYISPVMSSIVLQLFAYYIALGRGCPIDRPRNLAKSVTVE